MEKVNKWSRVHISQESGPDPFYAEYLLSPVQKVAQAGRERQHELDRDQAHFSEPYGRNVDLILFLLRYF